MSVENAARAAVWSWAVATAVVMVGLDPPEWNAGLLVAYYVFSLLFGFPVALTFCLALDLVVTTLRPPSKLLPTLIGGALAAPFVKALAWIALVGASSWRVVGPPLFWSLIGPVFVSESGFGVLAIVPAGAVAGALVSRTTSQRSSLTNLPLRSCSG